MRKVWYYQIWIQNYLDFIVLILIFILLAFWRSHVIISKCSIFGVFGCVRLFGLVKKKATLQIWPWKYFYFKKKIFNSEQNIIESYFSIPQYHFKLHENKINFGHNLFFIFKLFWKMFSPCSELAIFMYWTSISMNNLLSCCGLVDAIISASEKDLPVMKQSLNPGAVVWS